MANTQPAMAKGSLRVSSGLRQVTRVRQKSVPRPTMSHRPVPRRRLETARESAASTEPRMRILVTRPCRRIRGTQMIPFMPAGFLPSLGRIGCTTLMIPGRMNWVAIMLLRPLLGTSQTTTTSHPSMTTWSMAVLGAMTLLTHSWPCLILGRRPLKNLSTWTTSTSMLTSWNSLDELSFEWQARLLDYDRRSRSSHQCSAAGLTRRAVVDSCI